MRLRNHTMFRLRGGTSRSTLHEVFRGNSEGVVIANERSGIP
jgi:hypothetical protein